MYFLQNLRIQRNLFLTSMLSAGRVWEFHICAWTRYVPKEIPRMTGRTWPRERREWITVWGIYIAGSLTRSCKLDIEADRTIWGWQSRLSGSGSRSGILLLSKCELTCTRDQRGRWKGRSGSNWEIVLLGFGPFLRIKGMILSYKFMNICNSSWKRYLILKKRSDFF